MIYLPRKKSYEHMMFTILNDRMNLSKNDRFILSTLVKGYEGEVAVDTLFEKLVHDAIHLNGVLFDWNNTTFQIDKLTFLHGHLYLMEVKTLEGDYYIENGEWYSPSGIIMTDPMKQLDRAKTLLQKLLQYYRIMIPIRPYVIFPHPHFTLYNAPRDQPFIFPTQLNPFIHQLNQGSSNITKQHIKAAERLVSLSVEKSNKSRIPDYTYEILQRGIRCGECEKVFMKLIGRKIVCDRCGIIESTDDAVLKSVKEFRLLFPERRVTTDEIFKWCGGVVSLKCIRRILNKYFTRYIDSRQIYYLDK